MGAWLIFFTITGVANLMGVADILYNQLTSRAETTEVAIPLGRWTRGDCVEARPRAFQGAHRWYHVSAFRNRFFNLHIGTTGPLPLSMGL